MQRMILLASVCLSQAQDSTPGQEPWAEHYQELLIGVRGENVCTEAGREYAESMAQDLHQQRPPLEVTITDTPPLALTICVVNGEALKQVTCIGKGCGVILY